MTPDQVIDAVLRREFERGVRTWAAAKARQMSGDRGGLTRGGITALAWGEYKGWHRPATEVELNAIAEADARAFYRKRYIDNPGFGSIRNDALQAQVIDFGVNSGPARAIRWLQRVLQVPVTSVLDERTRKALDFYPSKLVNDALVAARLYMVDDVTDHDDDEKKFEEGWENRALEFFLSRPYDGEGEAA